MPNLHHLFEKNRRWAENIKAQQPDFFAELAHQQNPSYLWIGCSDSRVPANQITGLQPGEIFVHRNIANVVVHTDLNCLSVIQFAVEVLRVKHIIVCGHHGCSGVGAALRREKIGLADNWLRHIQDVHLKHSAMVDSLVEPTRRADLLAELNAVEQVVNVCQTTIVNDAWERGQELTVHGWVYSLGDGLVQDLAISVSSTVDVATTYTSAIDRLRKLFPSQ